MKLSLLQLVLILECRLCMHYEAGQFPNTTVLLVLTFKLHLLLIHADQPSMWLNNLSEDSSIHQNNGLLNVLPYGLCTPYFYSLYSLKSCKLGLILIAREVMI